MPPLNGSACHFWGLNFWSIALDFPGGSSPSRGLYGSQPSVRAFWHHLVIIHYPEISAAYEVLYSGPDFFEFVHAFECLRLHEFSIIHPLLKRFIHFAQQEDLALVVLSSQHSWLKELADEFAHSGLEVKPVEVALVLLRVDADGSVRARSCWFSHEEFNLNK